MITYRKTKQGEWVAFGPVAEFPQWTEATKVATVSVRTKDGSFKTETVERYGRPFAVDGTECMYGYLRKQQPAPRMSRQQRAYWAEYADGRA